MIALVRIVRTFSNRRFAGGGGDGLGGGGEGLGGGGDGDA